MSTQIIISIVSLAISVGTMLAIGITSYNRGYDDCLEDIERYITDIEEEHIKWKKWTI